MKHLALVLTLMLAGLALTGCGVKKTDPNGKTLFGAHLDFNAVPTGHGDGKSLDIDAGVTVNGSEFGFVTSGNGSYVKGVKGMDPTMEGALPPDQVYDPMSEPEPTPVSTPAPQADAAPRATAAPAPATSAPASTQGSQTGATPTPETAPQAPATPLPTTR